VNRGMEEQNEGRRKTKGKTNEERRREQNQEE
jgi:hypothetical protein